MRHNRLKKIVCGMLSFAFIFLIKTSFAAVVENYKVVNGVAIYLGIIPAEVILGRSTEHPKSKMHGGVPGGDISKDNIHVVVALFDNATGQRINNAQITAKVKQNGLESKTKILEPMKISDTITYGNYFVIGSQGEYRIILRIQRPNMPDVIETEFTHGHLPR